MRKLWEIAALQTPICAMQAREELIESVCQKEVGVYQQIFSTTGMSLLMPQNFFCSTPPPPPPPHHPEPMLLNVLQ